MEMPEDILSEMKAFRRAVQSERFRAEKPSTERKYRYSRSNNELGYRLVLGQDPARVPEEQLQEVDPLSVTTIRGLISDGDCPLYKVKLGGSVYVTESSVQQYEQYIATGEAPGYMQPSR